MVNGTDYMKCPLSSSLELRFFRLKAEDLTPKKKGREIPALSNRRRDAYSTLTAICFGFASSRCGSRMVSTPSL
jgi:hypothetical protein